MLKLNLRSIAAVAVAAGTIVCGLTVQSRADVTITIGKVSVFPGNVAVVGIFASSNSADVITGFNLPLDINNDGTVAQLPAGFTLGTPAFINAKYADTKLDANGTVSLIHVDSIATGSGSNLTLSSTPTDLLDLRFQVDPSTPVGTVMPLRIIAPASPFQDLFNIAGPNSPTTNPPVASPIIGTPAAGSVTVIPEPTLAGLLLISAGICFRRSRSKSV